MITTTLGDRDETTLDKREGTVDNDNELTTWVEYRLPGSEEIIHRSVHVRLKRNVTAAPAVGGF
jgi:hypothetical protein